MARPLARHPGERRLDRVVGPRCFHHGAPDAAGDQGPGRAGGTARACPALVTAAAPSLSRVRRRWLAPVRGEPPGQGIPATFRFMVSAPAAAPAGHPAHPCHWPTRPHPLGAGAAHGSYDSAGVGWPGRWMRPGIGCRGPRVGGRRRPLLPVHAGWGAARATDRHGRRRWERCQYGPANQAQDDHRRGGPVPASTRTMAKRPWPGGSPSAILVSFSSGLIRAGGHSPSRYRRSRPTGRERWCRAAALRRRSG